METIIAETDSLCPECLRTVPAVKKDDGRNVYLEKACPVHGVFTALIWRGDPSYRHWGEGEDAPGPVKRLTQTSGGCPHDCGLCPEHAAQTCTVLMEVTDRCDLNCPICFADAGKRSPGDPDLKEIRAMLEAVVAAGGPYPLQLSGGEPTTREDLPEIIRLAKDLGFEHVQLNTHGLKLARDKSWISRLKAAGLDLIYLQFDGVSDDVYRRIRGADLFRLKEQAVSNCAEAQIGVLLVPVLIPGVNDHQIGAIIQFAKQWIPVVKGVHFQPISYFGRYPDSPADEDRITTPDVLRALEAQTDGEIKASNFLPRRRWDSHCAFSGFFVLNEQDRLIATTRFDLPQKQPPMLTGPRAAASRGAETPAEHVRRFITHKSRMIDPVSKDCSCKQGGPLNSFFDRAMTHYLSISGMPFQDAWTVDLNRLKGCCIHVISRDRLLVPFCAFYLTDARGNRLNGRGAADNPGKAS